MTNEHADLKALEKQRIVSLSCSYVIYISHYLIIHSISYIIYIILYIRRGLFVLVEGAMECCYTVAKQRADHTNK